MNRKHFQESEIALRADCLKDPMRLDVAIVEAAMLWPDDPQWRERAVKASTVEFFKPGLSQLSRAMVEDLLRDASDGFPLAFIQDEIKKERFVRGAIAGNVLYNIIAEIELRPEDANMQRIAELCAKPYYPKYRVSPKTFNNEVWPTFRPVAHLWAAWIAGCKVDADTFFPCHSDRLGQFLADAEFFRQRGESRRTKKSPSTVLRAGEAVRLPAALEIAAAELHFSR